jgi:hypothetical protein
MKSRIFIKLTVILFSGLAGCDDPEEFTAKQLGPFSTIQSNGGVTFHLVSGVENKVISTSIGETQYNVSNGQLSVNAAGGSMTIAIKDLDLLWCNACTVDNTDLLVADTLNMYIHAGEVELRDIVINGQISLTAMNMGTYRFSGTANYFYVHNTNLTDVQAFDLVTDSTHVYSLNAIATDVHATQVLDVFISSAGDVIYKGDPPVIRLTQLGSGQLKKK